MTRDCCNPKTTWPVARAHPATSAKGTHSSVVVMSTERRAGRHVAKLSAVRTQPVSVDWKLTPGEPRRVSLDCLEVSGNRRTTTSATSLNY